MNGINQDASDMAGGGQDGMGSMRSSDWSKVLGWHGCNIWPLPNKDAM